MADGFLGRWSRRKLDVKQGRAVEAESPGGMPAPPSVIPASNSVIPASNSVIPAQAGIHPSPNRAPGEASGVDSRLRGNDDDMVRGNDDVTNAHQTPPPPTLDDVQALTAESDFSRFAAPDVAPEVKNAAMKKLFADPHFNVMDGLDVYIDDYSKPDPLPESMLRSLSSAEFLGLFREEENTAEPAAGLRVAADEQTAEFVAQSDAAACAAPEALSGLEPPARTPPDPAPPAAPDESAAVPHADPDLRLQQDHAAGPEGPGPGPR